MSALIDKWRELMGFEKWGGKTLTPMIAPDTQLDWVKILPWWATKDVEKADRIPKIADVPATEDRWVRLDSGDAKVNVRLRVHGDHLECHEALVRMCASSITMRRRKALEGVAGDVCFGDAVRDQEIVFARANVAVMVRADLRLWANRVLDVAQRVDAALAATVGVKPVVCDVCGKRHYLDSENYVTFHGNVYRGWRGGVVGNNFGDDGMHYRINTYCRDAGCLSGVVSNIAVAPPPPPPSNPDLRDWLKVMIVRQEAAFDHDSEDPEGIPYGKMRAYQDVLDFLEGV